MAHIDESYLSSLTIGTLDSGGLMNLCNAAKLQYKRQPLKAQRVRDLMAFYRQPDVVARIWAQLTPAEREFVTHYVQYDGDISGDYFKNFKKEHGIADRSRFYSFRTTFLDVFEHDSQIKLLFWNLVIPPFLMEELKRIIEPLKVHFTPVEVDLQGEEPHYIVDRDKRLEDFDLLIRLVSQGKVTATREVLTLSKPSAMALYKLARYPEVWFDMAYVPLSNIRNARETLVSHCLFDLLHAAQVLDISDTRVILGAHFDHYAAASQVERAKFLLASYLNAYRSRLDEVQFILNNNLRLYPPISWSAFRGYILETLKECPIGAWVGGAQFREVMRLYRNRVRATCTDLEYRENDGWYTNAFTPDYSQFEAPFIDISLHYLATLGLLDIVVEEMYTEYEKNVCLQVKYLRLTQLGAFLLGLTDHCALDATKPQIQGGLIVQPDFDIIIPQSVERLPLESQLSPILTKKTDDPQVSVYRIDFAGMVRLLDGGGSIPEFKAFLMEKARQAVPENVLRMLDGWAAQVGKVRIRTVILVEADDPFLLQEIKSLTGMKKIVTDEIQAALVIDPKQALKVKRAIEKSNHFCQIEE